MKKLMIAVAAVAIAAVSQAAMFNWSSDSKCYALDAASVTDNGNYTASSSVYMKSNGTWNYALTIYAAGTSTVVDSFEGALTVTGSKKLSFTTSESTLVADGTAYDYVLKITGTQTALNARGKETSGYDYTDAALSYTYAKGTVTTETMGTTAITGIDAPTSWTVSGITKETPEPTPEPTSAMLMLLGMAGLALRRKQKYAEKLRLEVEVDKGWLNFYCSPSPLTFTYITRQARPSSSGGLEFWGGEMVYCSHGKKGVSACA